VTRPRRVLIAGISGSGKTTLARKLSARWDLSCCELDALHHGPEWTPRPEFAADVRAFIARDRWVTEDQYHRVLGDLLWEHADTVIWLDLPRRTIMWRVIRRSVARFVLRRELWNGNRERLRDWVQPYHPIRWAWSQAESRGRETAERAERFPDVTVVHLRAAGEARRWLAAAL
jgi:adenylate kinase family enzyme